MPIWSAPSTTATKAALLLGLVLLPPASALAGAGLDRLLRSVHAIAPQALPARDALDRACAGDVVCTARLLARALGPRARLVPVVHPTTDRIRWVTSQPSVTGHAHDAKGRLTIALDHFGRKAVRELRTLAADAATTAQGISSLSLDLRANRGGDVDGMLRVAALFTGHIPDAVRLVGATRTSTLPVPALTSLFADYPLTVHLTVHVGPLTASSAEVLAALLKRHAGATIVGARTYGKDYLLHVVPVTHDLRLLVPGARIEVPGIALAGGLVPDVLIPPDVLTQTDPPTTGSAVAGTAPCTSADRC